MNFLALLANPVRFLDTENGTGELRPDIVILEYPRSAVTDGAREIDFLCVRRS
jgi:hypothetical protein